MQLVLLKSTFSFAGSWKMFGFCKLTKWSRAESVEDSATDRCFESSVFEVTVESELSLLSLFSCLRLCQKFNTNCYHKWRWKRKFRTSGDTTLKEWASWIKGKGSVTFSGKCRHPLMMIGFSSQRIRLLIRFVMSVKHKFHLGINVMTWPCSKVN